VDTAVEPLESVVDGGNSDEKAHKGGGDPYYFHPVGHVGLVLELELHQEHIPGILYVPLGGTSKVGPYLASNRIPEPIFA